MMIKGKFFSTALAMSLAIIFAAATASDDSASVTGAKLIAKELEQCPLWTEVSAHDIERREQITEVYIRIAKYPTETIRTGVALYLQRYPALGLEDFEAGEKIFALLRVIFTVPQRFNAAREVLPYGLLGNPVYSDGVDLIWPYSTSGRLVLSGVDPGIHAGPPYNPLFDFDQMASRLKRRFPSEH